MEKSRQQEKKDESASSCKWSSLPSDILDQILKKFNFFWDRLAVVSVCKGWRIPVVVPSGKLPWLSAINSSYFADEIRKILRMEINFYEPFNPIPYRREKRFNFPEMDGTIHNCQDLGIRDSKFGWLLLSVRKNKFEVGRYTNSHILLLYNPFTDTTVRIPDVDSPRIDTAAFSDSYPTSPDCVFFVSSQYKRERKMKIHTWQRGQEAWKEHVFESCGYWEIRNVVYHDGMFYCLCLTLTLEPLMASFNHSSGEWREISVPVNVNNFGRMPQERLIEWNGDIFFLMFGERDGEGDHLLFKFDPSEDAWVKTDDLLDDKVIFGSHQIPSNYSIFAEGEAMEVSNRVYTCACVSCREHIKMVYYSLKDRKLYQDIHLHVGNRHPITAYLAPPSPFLAVGTKHIPRDFFQTKYGRNVEILRIRN